MSEYNYSERCVKKVLIPLGEALSCRASPLQKQSTGLFLNSPFAERFAVICGALPHTPQGLSALDLTKGLQTLWNPLILVIINILNFCNKFV